jgi:hypothetical protein
VRVNDTAILAQVSSLIPPVSVFSNAETVDELYSFFLGPDRTGSRVRRYHLIYQNAERLVRTLDLEEALDVLRRQLELTVAMLAPRRLFVRGGAVAWGDRAIVLPGDDADEVEALVDALVEAGGIRYSARYAVFGGHGDVHPYPAQASRDPLPVDTIAFRRPTAARGRLLSPGLGVIGLLTQAVASPLRAAYALRTLERVVATARILELPVASPKDQLPWLLNRSAFSPVRERAS